MTLLCDIYLCKTIDDFPPYRPKQVYRELINSMRYLDENGSDKHFRDLLKHISNKDNYCYILSGIGTLSKSIGLKGFIISIDEGEKFFDFGGLYNKIALNRAANGELIKIRSAHDREILTYKVIDKEASYTELIEKGRADKIIAKDAEKENAIVITCDTDFYGINPDISIIKYLYYPPKQKEIIDIKIIGKTEGGDGVGYYKNYTNL